MQQFMNEFPPNNCELFVLENMLDITIGRRCVDYVEIISATNALPISVVELYLLKYVL